MDIRDIENWEDFTLDLDDAVACRGMARTRIIAAHDTLCGLAECRSVQFSLHAVTHIDHPEMVNWADAAKRLDPKLDSETLALLDRGTCREQWPDYGRMRVFDSCLVNCVGKADITRQFMSRFPIDATPDPIMFNPDSVSLELYAELLSKLCIRKPDLEPLLQWAAARRSGEPALAVFVTGWSGLAAGTAKDFSCSLLEGWHRALLTPYLDIEGVRTLLRAGIGNLATDAFTIDAPVYCTPSGQVLGLLARLRDSVASGDASALRGVSLRAFPPVHTELLARGGYLVERLKIDRDVFVPDYPWGKDPTDLTTVPRPAGYGEQVLPIVPGKLVLMPTRCRSAIDALPTAAMFVRHEE